MSESKTRPVVVTTAHRGVFFGYTADADDAETIRLERARMCVYWPAANHGVLGLAERGPLSEARVSPAVQRITLRNITAVIAVTPEAAERWEAEPWAS